MTAPEQQGSPAVPGARPVSRPPADLPAPILWPVGTGGPHPVADDNIEALVTPVFPDGEEFVTDAGRPPRPRGTARPRRRIKAPRSARRPQQSWLPLPGSPVVAGTSTRIVPRGLGFGQSVSVRDGSVTFTGPRSAPLALPLDTMSKVIVVERINLGRGPRMVVIFCGPDGRQVRALHQGRWAPEDLFAIARAVSAQPMFYPGRTTARRLESEHPGALTFAARHAVHFTVGALVAVTLLPFALIAFMVWVLTLIF